MDPTLLVMILSPPILFFVFGLFAGFVRSNLEIPPNIAKFFSLYLLMAIGFKGGISLSGSGFDQGMVLALLAALALAILVPAYTFAILSRRINRYDAAAVAATYGSVSAVTFIAASAFLTGLGIPFGGYMTVALVLMESPAIIMAVYLSSLARRQRAVPATGASAVGAAATPVALTRHSETADGGPPSVASVLREALTDGANLLLLGSMAIGAITGSAGQAALQPFTGAIFSGILAFFLLDMGLLVARRLRESRSIGGFLVAFALLVPMTNAALATAIAGVMGLAMGDTILLAVLAASSSYIVVPAVVRHAIPEANPGIYFTMSLAMTFPFNLTIGIPLYTAVIRLLWGDVL